MLELIFTFTEEFLILCYILSGILWCSFTKTSNLLRQKAVYFLVLRGTLFFLFSLMVFNIWQISQVQNQFYPYLDFLSLTEYYNVTLSDPYGQCFLRKDSLVNFYNIILNSLVFFYLLLLYDYTKTTNSTQKYYLEIPVLLITVLFGLKIFLMAYDFILMVLALELTAFCSVILIALQFSLNRTVLTIFPFEAAIKYFVFNAVSIGLFLFAVSGYYSLFKTLNLLTITNSFLFEPAFCYENLETLVFFHFFFFVGYLMKLGAAPFHQWVPDVYEGAELMITAFLVLIVGPILNFKLFIFIKTLLPVFEMNSVIFGGFFICGFISLIFGSFNAFTQFRIKRFLAYTGITHLGYMLLSFGTGTFIGFFASFFYLMFYIITNCLFFSSLIIAKKFSKFSVTFFNQLKILVNGNFFLLFFFLIAILSFAGFPPFAGFFSKFFVLFSVIDLNKISLTLFILLYIIVSAYLYLRFIKVILFENTNYNLYLPLKRTTQDYYLIQQDYRALQPLFQTQQSLLFLLFLFTCLISLVIVFLPTFCLLFQKPLITLFLFF